MKTNISILVNVRGVKIGADETLKWLTEVIDKGLWRHDRSLTATADFINGTITIYRVPQ